MRRRGPDQKSSLILSNPVRKSVNGTDLCCAGLRRPLLMPGNRNSDRPTDAGLAYGKRSRAFAGKAGRQEGVCVIGRITRPAHSPFAPSRRSALPPHLDTTSDGEKRIQALPGVVKNWAKSKPKANGWWRPHGWERRKPKIPHRLWRGHSMRLDCYLIYTFCWFWGWRMAACASITFGTWRIMSCWSCTKPSLPANFLVKRWLCWHLSACWLEVKASCARCRVDRRSNHRRRFYISIFVHGGSKTNYRETRYCFCSIITIDGRRLSPYARAWDINNGSGSLLHWSQLRGLGIGSQVWWPASCFASKLYLLVSSGSTACRFLLRVSAFSVPFGTFYYNIALQWCNFWSIKDSIDTTNWPRQTYAALVDNLKVHVRSVADAFPHVWIWLYLLLASGHFTTIDSSSSLIS